MPLKRTYNHPDRWSPNRLAVSGAVTLAADLPKELPIAAVVLVDVGRSLMFLWNANICSVREISTIRVCQTDWRHQYSDGFFAGMLFATCRLVADSLLVSRIL